jgi:hypothetical protein
MKHSIIFVSSFSIKRSTAEKISLSSQSKYFHFSAAKTRLACWSGRTSSENIEADNRIAETFPTKDIFLLLLCPFVFFNFHISSLLQSLPEHHSNLRLVTATFAVIR